LPAAASFADERGPHVADRSVGQDKQDVEPAVHICQRRVFGKESVRSGHAAAYGRGCHGRENAGVLVEFHFAEHQNPVWRDGDYVGFARPKAPRFRHVVCSDYGPAKRPEICGGNAFAGRSLTACS